MGTMAPVISAIGMKTAGEISPSEERQRSSSSAPTMRPLSAMTMG